MGLHWLLPSFIWHHLGDLCFLISKQSWWSFYALYRYNIVEVSCCYVSLSRICNIGEGLNGDHWSLYLTLHTRLGYGFSFICHQLLNAGGNFFTNKKKKVSGKYDIPETIGSRWDLGVMGLLLMLKELTKPLWCVNFFKRASWFKLKLLHRSNYLVLKGISHSTFVTITFLMFLIPS